MTIPTHIPKWLQQFWDENPTIYTEEDILHLEPSGLNAVFLKHLIESGHATLTLELNGVEIGSYNGKSSEDIDINLGTLTIQKNGTTVAEYNGNQSATANINLGTLTIQKNGTTVAEYNGNQAAAANITVPNVTFGTGTPSGGANGDVYMRYA
jgi:hypothetical protein